MHYDENSDVSEAGVNSSSVYNRIWCYAIDLDDAPNSKCIIEGDVHL